MLLTITLHYSKHDRRRYVLEQDGVRTHMLNDESLHWHLSNKLMLNKDQCEQVFGELMNHFSATLELVPTQEQAAS